jgi:phage tail protein X
MASPTYTTRSGDTWDAISFRVFGTENYMDLLLDKNPQQNGVARFDAGVVLDVPALPDPVRPTSLPPWRVT